MIKDGLKGREKRVLLRTLTPKFVSNLERVGRVWKLPKDVIYKGKVFKNKSLGNIETTVFDLEFESVSIWLQLLVGSSYGLPVGILACVVIAYRYYNYTLNPTTNVVSIVLGTILLYLIVTIVNRFLVDPTVYWLQTRRIKLAMSCKEISKS